MITDKELKELKKLIIKLLFKTRKPSKNLELGDIKLKNQLEFTSYIGYRLYCFNLQFFYIKKFKETEFRYAIPESVSNCGKSFIGRDGKFMMYADQLQLLETKELLEGK
ncbi:MULTISPECIES: hypothetical protein [Clostridium]|jgi:hypothetical protein|uniref:hypothetical protein n=1 Tax=Clostridium TaxID=1485 RepID=UPI000288AA87|nr:MULTISPECIES: hypothetical protein [Clostridium]MDF2504909.1 hypothetical protein [Clostridium sp.]